MKTTNNIYKNNLNLYYLLLKIAYATYAYFDKHLYYKVQISCLSK